MFGRVWANDALRRRRSSLPGFLSCGETPEWSEGMSTWS